MMEVEAADRLHSNKRMNVEADRLSSLPNDLIHKILSFNSINETVKTMVLSSRYRLIWTTMPHLNFSTQDFPKPKKFAKFVTRFLSRRNSQIDVFYLKLSFRETVTKRPVKKLMEYAFSHNIQQLDVECLLLNGFEFPFSLFRSQSLKNLSLRSMKIKATSTLEIPTLTTLYLHDVTFVVRTSVGLLSKCANLKNLTLNKCKTEGLTSFGICHPGLSNLTLDDLHWGVKVVNVVAPQLENLIIRYCSNKTEYAISAPNLTSFDYHGHYPLHLSTDGFHCLKEASILIMYPNVDDAHHIVTLLQHLHNVKFLTLNLETIELLSSSMELISHQPSPFVNLKSLTIYPKWLYEWEMCGLPRGKVNLCTELKKYLLDSSPGAILTMFSREEIVAVKNIPSIKKLMEIVAVKNIPSIKKLMAELRVLLEQVKANTKTKGKAPNESHNAEMHEQGKLQPEMKMHLHIGGNMSLIKSCCKDMSAQFELDFGPGACCNILKMEIFFKVESIERLLSKLPASNRAMIQPCFSNLCAEADIIMSKIYKM